MATSVQVRDELVEVLRRDLVGPRPADGDAEEVLDQPPSRWYLTGFLVPYEAPDEQRCDETAQEGLDFGGDDGGDGGDDGAAPEQASARRAFFPSSIGVSVLVPVDATELVVSATWGDYRPLPVEGGDETPKPRHDPREERWARAPRIETLTLPISRRGRVTHDVPGSGGLKVVVSVRPVRAPVAAHESLVPPGTRAVSVFLVNHRVPKEDQRRDEAFIFQARLAVQCASSFVARPDLRGRDTDDPDERVAELQYRDAFEYAVGHGVATHAICSGPTTCHAVETTWVPSAEVEKVVPGVLPDPSVVLGMEALGALTDGASLRAALQGLATCYGAWIAAQRATSTGTPYRDAVAAELLDRAGYARTRIEDGVALLEADPEARRAFNAMNLAMARAARQRSPDDYAAGSAPPAWRPFQLAFVLMNLRAIAEPSHPDRRLVDLLFFPTGGGKTEAYLGIAAFTILLRRRRHGGPRSAGGV